MNIFKKRLLVQIIFIGIIFFVIPFNALSELILKDIDSNETKNYTLNNRFSYENSLGRLNQIKSALNSFCLLTDKAEKVLPLSEMKNIDNANKETQLIGFPNWTGSIEGTLRKQQYQIKQLEYELAQIKFDQGIIKKEELLKKKSDFEQEEKEFQKFWDNFHVVD
jgi:hypothetical protein